MSWLRCAETRPWAATRLFCLPHAGGSAVFYRAWAKEVDPAVEVHAVQYPGRADRMRDPMIEDAHRVARLIAGAIAPLLDRPAALFGHSMGAVLAYEVTRLLAERGSAPVHLFVSGARPPHDRGEREGIADRSDDGVVAALAELGGTDVELLGDPELRELVLPYVRNDFRLIENYVPLPGPPVDVPTTALIGDADPHVNETQAAGWADAVGGDFTLKVLPGDHFYLMDRRKDVIDEIMRTL